MRRLVDAKGKAAFRIYIFRCQEKAGPAAFNCTIDDGQEMAQLSMCISFPFLFLKHDLQADGYLSSWFENTKGDGN